MIGKIILHYKILEKLGEGGMGVVYKAEDTKLKRIVAIKFLPRQIAASEEERERFKIEAQAAAALNHPNIATIHAIEEVEDEMFIVMEFIEGEELKKKVTSEQLSVNRVIAIASQIAEGLKAAHAKGVIHRDIKSNNIMVTESGRVKIMDFGLAKISGSSHLTKDHSTLGTAAYMSPEQVRGEAVDHRTDIWSFGVVLYEMMTGQLPFKGEKLPAIVFSILMNEPKPLAQLRGEIPGEFEQIVNRMLAKDADKRYQRVDEMLEGLAAFKKKFETGDIETRPRPSLRFIRKRVYVYGGIASVVILLAAVWLGNNLLHNETIDSVAVLPFVNVSADSSIEYLCDGLSEEVIRSLSQLPRLKVMSFSAVSRYRGEGISSQTVGRDLNVNAVLFGRITLRGDALSISAELADARDNRHLWGENYDRKLNELLFVQDEITHAIAYKLQPGLTGDEKKRLTMRRTENFEAYQLYLKGRFHTAKFNKEGYEKGLAYFSQAVVKDPNYALAYDGLAYYYGNSLEWMMSPKEALPLAKEAAMKALALDESLAEAHASLGNVYLFYDWDLLAAEREFKRAIQLNPNYVTTYVYYAHYWVASGRFDEALVVMKRAYEIEPLSPDVNTFLGWTLIMAGEPELAIAQLNNALEIDPNFWFAHLMLGVAHETSGRLAEACAEYEKASMIEGEFSEGLANLGLCYARQRKIDEARKILAELKQRAENGYVPPYFFFMIHFALGEKDKALPWFEAAFEQRCIYLLWDKVFSYADYQRSDPRLAAILDKVGVKN